MKILMGVSGFPLKAITRRPPVVIAGLAAVALLAFAGVTRLVNRFSEQQKAVARHLFDQGQVDLEAGHPERAIELFRSALLYSRDNFDYQLSLARALRDSGHTAESESYLISLWERSPQSAAVNLALGRLAAREGLVDKAVQYYHNAIYGVWPGVPDTNRLNARFELIEFLLREKAFPQAQAELITLSSQLPNDPVLGLKVAEQFARAGDVEHALSQYQRVLSIDPRNAFAFAGAGRSAFDLARYRTAAHFLEAATKVLPQDPDSATLLGRTRLILESDPFSREISSAERERRVRRAFDQAGARLNACAAAANGDHSASSPPSNLSDLADRWRQMKSKMTRSHDKEASDLAASAMGLVFEIEEQTQTQCGPPSGLDEALLLLGRNRGGVER